MDYTIYLMLKDNEINSLKLKNSFKIVKIVENKDEFNNILTRYSNFKNVLFIIDAELFNPNELILKIKDIKELNKDSEVIVIIPSEYESEYIDKLFEVGVIDFFYKSELNNSIIENFLKDIKILNKNRYKLSSDKKVRHSYDFFESVLDSLGHGLVVINLKGRIIRLNKVAKDIINNIKFNDDKDINFDKKELRLNITYLLPLNLEEITNFPFKRVIYLNYKSEKRLFEINIYPYMDIQGIHIGYLLHLQDITEIEKQKKVLEEEKKWISLGKLSAKLAHELGNPLASIKTTLQVLKRNNEKFSAGRRREYLINLLGEIDRLDNIIRDFLLFARPKTINFAKVDLKEVCLSIYLQYQEHLIERDISLRYSIPDSARYVCGEEVRIRQILINLINNSMDAIESKKVKGIIEIKSFLKDEYICLKVIDNGEGMDEEVLNQAFTTFFTTKEHGTGLGLSICNEIMRKLEGDIKVKSEVGKGTEVSLYFKPYKEKK